MGSNSPFEKIVLVTRKTRLEALVERFNTLGQAKFYIEHAGADFSDYQAEYDTYQAALEQLRRDLQGLARLHPIERSFLPNYLFTPKDLVVTAGQDGLVVNTAKYLDGQPIVAVNPDPLRFDGVLLPYSPELAAAAVVQVLEDKARYRSITMAEARLSDGQKLLAFNDLFIGPRSHTSARYVIRFAERSEIHSSSGIIVATGAGSSGWLSSLYNMAVGIMPLIGGGQDEVVPLQQSEESVTEIQPYPGSYFPAVDSRFDWESDLLRFVIREPFRSRTSQADLVWGEIVPGRELHLESRMPEEGVIFSDGVESDFLRFNAGTLATIGIAERKTRLVVPG